MGLEISPFAPIDSPAFTGTPTATTQSVGDNSTKIATTAFVIANAAGTSIGLSLMIKTGNYSYNL